MRAEVPTHHFRAKGKVLLCGEYFVLDGALALAVPTVFGQDVRIWEQGGEPGALLWTSKNAEGEVWFRARWEITGNQLSLDWSEGEEVADRLVEILQAAIQQDPAVAERLTQTQVETQLDFPRKWGLGTSSTLLYALAKWLELDAWQLMNDSFGGSGYDLACAGAELPILYRLVDGKPHYVQVQWQPAFAENCHFVYLEKKQNSREGIAHYRAKGPFAQEVLDDIERISLLMTQTTDLEEAQALLKEHEALVAEHLDLETVTARHFEDFAGTVKSLGAWGGDFVWAISTQSAVEVKAYFNEKGFSTVLSWEEMFGNEEKPDFGDSLKLKKN